ncbi:hypothetical protein DER46DRAFT_630185 [Fusarium sp. MPI-SDFR-AT-0072]|nr:hypothetical protein DER46DRAFT_630185 [Fusarium sp. MPI-SDFR-AT-0072]
MSTLGWIRRYRGKRPKTSPRIRQGHIDMYRRLLARWPLIQDWSEGNIIWTDEKTFYNVFIGRKGVTVHRSEPIRDYRRARLHGHSQNFWGSFCGSIIGPGFLFPVGYNNNARYYADGPLQLIYSFFRELQTAYSLVNLWSIIEGWIEDNFQVDTLTQDGQNEAIIAARDAIPADLLKSLSLSNRDRLQQCIEKEGWPLDY